MVQGNFFASCYHDALILYSMAINETLHEGGDIRDGLTLRNKMWNRTFQGNSNNSTHICGQFWKHSSRSFDSEMYSTILHYYHVINLKGNWLGTDFR